MLVTDDGNGVVDHGDAILIGKDSYKLLERPDGTATLLYESKKGDFVSGRFAGAHVRRGVDGRWEAADSQWQYPDLRVPISRIRINREAADLLNKLQERYTKALAAANENVERK